MSLFKRRSNGGPLGRVLESEAKAIDKVFRRAVNGGPIDEDEFDLESLVVELFEAAPTDDVRTLRDRDVDARAFFEDELRPNWDDRTRGERSAKIQAFMRLANALGTDDAAGLGAVVRTKVVVLAWAYDRVYSQDLLRQLSRTPQSFGTMQPAG